MTDASIPDVGPAATKPRRSPAGGVVSGETPHPPADNRRADGRQPTK